MRRSILRLLFGAAAAISVAGCSDTAVAPTQATSARSAMSVTSAAALSKSEQVTKLGKIRISPDGGTYDLGAFQLVVPAGAVCDMKVTQYGPQYWNDDCVAVRHNVKVDVTVHRADGQAWIEFSPDLRFRPAAGDVIIQTSAFQDLLLSDAVRQLPSDARFFQQFAILYTVDGNATVNEAMALGDPSLVTHVDRKTGLIWRRIKHFTGYLVSAFKCDLLTDPTCSSDGNGGSGDGLVGAASVNFSVVVSP